eukprot:3984020-Prymnesium_polylepis.1
MDTAARHVVGRRCAIALALGPRTSDRIWALSFKPCELTGPVARVLMCIFRSRRAPCAFSESPHGRGSRSPAARPGTRQHRCE